MTGAASAAPLLPRGFATATASASIKKPGRDDMALVRCAPGTALAAMYTTNRVCAAPVQLSRRALHESGGRCGALLINSGCANAATGAQGMADAQAIAAAVARACGIPVEQVQANSTGVIGVRLPVDRMAACIPQMASAANDAGAASNARTASSARPAGSAGTAGNATVESLARAIMTTDTYPKMAERTCVHNGRVCRVAGVAKGAGMIHPNMATMISVLMTDAAVQPAELQAHLRAAVDRSFHRISIDGDTSTNDAVFALASGAAEREARDERDAHDVRGASARRPAHAPPTTPSLDLRTAMIEVARELALLIVRDGEGFERGIRVHVTGARTQEDALTVARTVASSLLVRCAVTGGDPNWGRILAAAGRSGVDISEDTLALSVGGVALFAQGQPAATPLAEREAAFRQQMVEIALDLGQGDAADEFISCGLTKAYVELNADYTT